MKRFTLLLIFVALLLYGSGYVLTSLGRLHATSIDVYLLLFLTLLTIVVHWINLGAVKESGQTSVIMMILSMVIKLLLGGAMLLYIIYQYPTRAIEIVVEFFIIYILYTSLDIYLVRKSISV